MRENAEDPPSTCPGGQRGSYPVGAWRHLGGIEVGRRRAKRERAPHRVSSVNRPSEKSEKMSEADRQGVQATTSTTSLVHSSAEREQVYDKHIEDASEQATRSCIGSSARCETKTQGAPSEQSPTPCSTSGKKGIRLIGVRLR